MLTLLANLKNYVILGLCGLLIATFAYLKIDEERLKLCKESNAKAVQAITDQNKAVEQLQEDAYARQEKLSIIEKKVNSDRIRSQKEAADLLSIHIPPGCNEAIKYGISESQMGK
jgi:hypothetical protein